MATAVIIAILFAIYLTFTGGVGVVIDREGAARAAQLADRANHGKRFGGAIPLWSPRFGGLRGRSEAETLTALCDALSARPNLRARLADPQRAQQLLADLRAWSGRLVQHRGGLRRKRFETMAAAARLGYIHHNGGRPLPDEHLPSLDTVVDGVMHGLEGNPYSKYLRIDRRKVMAVLDEHYVSVKPWPFAALTD